MTERTGPGMHHYDAEFYRYIGESSLRSARRVIAMLRGLLDAPVASVLDVGCGAGAWLVAWKEQGCEVFGVDGAHVSPDALIIDASEFRAHDLRLAMDLGRRFALVQCLEVAEHLPAAAAPVLVASLCRHADLVLFSAAPPGQGGESHLNEQPYAYWRDHFAAHGYTLYDPLRRRILRDDGIMPWYRYNTFVFLRDDGAPELHRRLADARVPPGAAPPDLSPRSYRLRKRLVAWLPVAASTLIATLKKRFFNLLGRS
jgi:SAM-dependent methyltransferase